MVDEQIFINKIIKLQEIVKNVIRSNQLYKALGFLEANDLNSCATYAESIYLKLGQLDRTIKNETYNEDEIIVILQDIVREISTLISLYGCDSIENLIHICIGHKFSIEEKYREKYDLLKTYVKPVRYKILDWRTKLKPSDDSICKTADNFECFDFTNEIFDINFHYRIYGIKFAIHNMEKQHTLIIYGLIEDVMTDFIENRTLKTKIEELKSMAIDEIDEKSYERYIKCLTLKELLIYPVKIIRDKYLSYKEQFTSINKKPLSTSLCISGEFNVIKSYIVFLA